MTIAGVAVEAGEPTPWPWPDDIPTPSKETPALAGGRPDMVRYLMVRGARGELSPDGRQIAYLTSVSGEPQLWVVDVDGGFPTQLTFGLGIRSFRWLPDGSAILYGADRDGNERQGYTLISPDGQFETEVLAASEAFVSFGSFASDAQQFVYSTTARNGVDFDVHLTNLADGSDRALYQGRFGFFASAWQPGGALVLVNETRGEDANDVYLLSTTSGQMEPLFQPQVAASYASYAWDDNGDGFYLVSNQDREFAGLAWYDLRERAMHWLETPDADVEQVKLFGRGRYVAWTVNVGGYSELHLYDLRRQQALEAPTRMPEGVYGLSGAHDAPRLMVRVSGPRAPGALWVWDVAQGAARAVVPASGAGLDLSAMAVPESRFFEARDGVRLHGLLYLPEAGDNGAPPPVVMKVHGGPTGQARPRFDAV
ncbi:MAG: S9 family peptidase, partial [Pseudomonadota bacterium]